MPPSKILSALVASALACLGSAALAAGTNDLPRTVLLNGSDWFIHEDSPGSNSAAAFAEDDTKAAGWIRATVPGNIQSDLEAAHRLGPLWYAGGSPGLSAVAHKNWWYRKDFFVPKSFAGKRVKLVFDGVDYQCEVYVNARRVGGNAGMFRRFSFDVADLLQPGRTNHLAVRIDRKPPTLPESNDIVKTRRLLKDLKSPTNWGWDWGIPIYTLGIWKGVRLEATGAARINWTQVQTRLRDHYQKASIRVRLDINSLSNVVARARFLVLGHGVRIAKTVSAAVHPGRNFIEATLPLDHPALWWPNGQGRQSLYQLEAQLVAAGSGQILDSRATWFGVREIRWEEVEGAPSDFINPFRLIINGRPVRTMGSNIVPPDLLFGRIDQRAPRLLRLARAQGMNTLRIWGGGVILPQSFYDLADRLGIMLTQGFPLTFGLPETNAVFLKNLRRTTSNIVKQLRNHPSIIEWSGGNELPWKQGDDYPALKVLEQVVASGDNRIFRATCPIQGSNHGPYYYNPQTLYRHYNTLQTMRNSEFGCQTPANLETWLRYIPPADRWPITGYDDPVLIRKKAVRAFGAPYWLGKPVIEGLFGAAPNLASLIRAGQFLSGEGLRYEIDALRRKGARVGGFTTWDYDEPWPNAAGSFQVGYLGCPLMNYDFVRQALAPVSLTLRYDSILYNPAAGLDAELWLTSDAPKPAKDLHWSWRARDRRGKVFAANEGTASIRPQEALDLGPIHVHPPARTRLGPILIELKLAGRRGKTLAERVHVFAGDNVAGPLRGLLDNARPDPDDPPEEEPQGHRQLPLRVLWIQDWNDGRYAGIQAACERYLSVRFTTVQAGRAALAKVATSPENLVKNFDVLWLGEGDYRNPERLAARLGTRNLQVLADAVRLGLGLGVEGGWGGYADAGLKSSPLAAVLPVTFSETGDKNRGGPTALKLTGARESLGAGKLGKHLPTLPGFNPLQAKAGATVVLATPSDDDILTVREIRKGRVLAYAAGTAGGWALDSWKAFPAFVSRMLAWLGGRSNAAVARIGHRILDGLPSHPVRRTTWNVAGESVRWRRNREVLKITLRNTGPMTALFCQPHPLLEYRTDLIIKNNHCSIPPGQSRILTIRAPADPKGGLTLAQTGWRITSWNANDLVIKPSSDVLLAVGRRDAMCREFLGGAKSPHQHASGAAALLGVDPEAGQIPYLLEGPDEPGKESKPVRFSFEARAKEVGRPSVLRIHTADQDRTTGPIVEVTVNGKPFERTLPTGLGIQRTSPAHLAFSATATFNLPSGLLRKGRNTLEVRVKNQSWFTWDSVDWVSIDNLREATLWLTQKSHQMIRTSRRRTADGIAAFPPQAGAGYNAFWLRDYAYMLEGNINAFHPEELRDAYLFFMKAQRADGAMVDCVKFNGTPVYEPGYGSMGKNPVADGSQFTVDVAWRTYQKLHDPSLIADTLDRLIRAMDVVPRDPTNGLVYIKPGPGWDRCPYGFTDSVRKQGDILFCSLLFVQASRQLADLCEVVGRKAEARHWRNEGAQTARAIRRVFWDPTIHLFRAATAQCRQPDIWGSAFAVYLGVATPPQSQAIAGYFKTHYHEIVKRGQLRHLPGGVFWKVAGARGQYQNGAYWATPVGWFVYTLDLADPGLADRTVLDMVTDFIDTGDVNECINDHYANVKNYIASAALPLDGIAAMERRRQARND